jgi:hypothetical protein
MQPRRPLFLLTRESIQDQLRPVTISFPAASTVQFFKASRAAHRTARKARTAMGNPMTSSTSESTAERRRAGELLRGFDPARLLVVSDMSGTLLTQTPGGFPADERRDLRALLDRGMLLLVVTGDSLATVRRHFVEPLAYSGPQPFFAATGSAYRLDQFSASGSEQLFQGEAVPRAVRSRVLDEIEGALRPLAAGDFKLAEREREVLLSGDGGRIDLAPHLPRLHGTLFLEVIPNKVTVYFPLVHVAAGAAAEFLRAVASNPAVRALAEGHNVHLIPGANFVDFIAAPKEAGVAMFLASSAARKYQAADRSVVVLADGLNDKGLLRFEFGANALVARVFLGQDEGFARSVQKPGGDPNFIFLRNEYTAGAAFILRTLLKS